MKILCFLVFLVVSKASFAEFGTFLLNCVEERPMGFTPIKAQFEIRSGKLWDGDRHIIDVEELKTISFNLPNEQGIKLKCDVKKKETATTTNENCCKPWMHCEEDLPICPSTPSTRPRCNWGSTSPECFPNKRK